MKPTNDPGSVVVRLAARLITAVESLFDRLFSSRWNPLYQSGTVAIAAFLVMLVSGLYLFIFYTISAPYASVVRIEQEIFLGSLARSSHRYAADVAIVAAAIHAVKMFSQGKFWGPRALAWISGIFLLISLLICGWTGMIMAWDVQGQWIAVQIATIFGAAPLFSEPLTRLFDGRDAVAGSFFFMNLFLHVSLPLGSAMVFLIHVFRLARPKMLPPGRLNAAVVLAIIAASVLMPIRLLPEANQLAAYQTVPIDIFYSFWLPLTRHLTPGGSFLFWIAATTALVAIPWWLKPKNAKIVPSYVNPKLCTGCSTCYEDCPFDAISMFPRDEPSPLSDFYAKVDMEKCVSCGICAGSCAPMGVGPAQRTGRFQFEEIQQFVDTGPPIEAGIVLFSCAKGPGRASLEQKLPDAIHHPVNCVGELHTSVIEYTLRKGASGALVLSCPERDAVCREGPKWADLRIFHDREAELHNRVDKQRVRLISFAPSETLQIRQAFEQFAADMAQLDGPVAEATVELETICEPITELPE